jgi:hypothetical protein
MTSQVIPITSNPVQTFNVALGSQQCTITLYQKSTGLFMDLAANGNQILNAMLCLDRVGLVRGAYLGFSGQLSFVDTQGYNDPYYLQLGTRYILVYTA